MPFFTSITGGRRTSPPPVASSSRVAAGINVRFTRQRDLPIHTGAMFHAAKQGTEDARAAVLGSAASFSEIFNLIPRAYAETLRKPLREISEIASKAVGVAHALDNLRHHRASGTWPPALVGVHFPKIELTAAFQATQPAALTSMRDAYDSYRTLALEQAISLKSAEHDFLRAKLVPSSYLPRLGDLLAQRWSEVDQTVRKPVYGVGESGQQTLDSYVESPAAKAEYNRLVVDLPQFCGRLILLEDTRYLAEKNKREDKNKLKADADVEMGEIPSSETAISDIVEKTVAKALKKLSIKVSTSFADNVAHYTDASSVGKRLWSEVSSQTRKRRRIEEQGQGNGCQVQETSTQAEEEERRWEERQEVEVVAGLITSHFRYDVPATYPDELLTIPRPLAIRLLLRASSIGTLETARFRAGVHLGPGTNVPGFICIHISAGARYLPKVVPHSNKLQSSYEDFCDRLRWRLYWTAKELSSEAEIKPYDPDYEYPHDRNMCDYKIDYIEKGLEQGRAYIDAFVEEVIPTLQRSQRYKPDLVDVKTVLSFLEDNDYLVLPTDKNLGQSVVTRQWFMSETAKLLNDPKSYKEISLERAKEILESQRMKMMSLADNAITFFGHEQLANFLRSNTDVGDEPKYVIPRFYGIPKIHKNPMRMRPIVPCHQAMQNPAAKYVSKNLKPVVEQLPYVIKGTKDMATKLAKLTLDPRRKFFLVGFDLVAFYTNIDLQYCIESCKTYYKEVVKPDISSLVMMSHALNVAFKNLIFEFDGKFYQQLNGIAMGVAASPDGANIFAAVHEEEFLERDSLSSRRIAFYGRYIDDGFMIVYAETAEDALAYSKSLVRFPGLELTWEVSERSLNFLDLMVYVNPLSMALDWKPFRKARNNLERIPFASHHPMDIKRGTFMGEMSRMAILCSSSANYIDALNDLASIYVARGYPYPLVRKWIKDNSAKRWQNRFADRRVSHVSDVRSSKLLVLKTTFDPVWEAFNVHELSDIIVKQWSLEIAAKRRRWDSFWNSGVNRRLDGQTSTRSLQDIGHQRSEALVVNPDDKREESAASMTTSWVERQDEKADDCWIPELRKIRGSASSEIGRVLDVSKLGFTDARWLVSRKKVRGLSDILNKLKRETLDENSRLKLLNEARRLPLDTETADGDFYEEAMSVVD